jgi:hypothetical protein
MTGLNPRSEEMRQRPRAFMPYTTERGFTLESPTISSVACSDIGGTTMLVSQAPFQLASCLSSAIGQKGSDGAWCVWPISATLQSGYGNDGAALKVLRSQTFVLPWGKGGVSEWCVNSLGSQ